MAATLDHSLFARENQLEMAVEQALYRPWPKEVTTQHGADVANGVIEPSMIRDCCNCLGI